MTCTSEEELVNVTWALQGVSLAVLVDVGQSRSRPKGYAVFYRFCTSF